MIELKLSKNLLNGECYIIPKMLFNNCSDYLKLKILELINTNIPQALVATRLNKKDVDYLVKHEIITGDTEELLQIVTKKSKKVPLDYSNTIYKDNNIILYNNYNILYKSTDKKVAQNATNYYTIVTKWNELNKTRSDLKTHVRATKEMCDKYGVDEVTGSLDNYKLVVYDMDSWYSYKFGADLTRFIKSKMYWKFLPKHFKKSEFEKSFNSVVEAKGKSVEII